MPTRVSPVWKQFPSQLFQSNHIELQDTSEPPSRSVPPARRSEMDPRHALPRRPATLNMVYLSGERKVFTKEPIWCYRWWIPEPTFTNKQTNCGLLLDCLTVYTEQSISLRCSSKRGIASNDRVLIACHCFEPQRSRLHDKLYKLFSALKAKFPEQLHLWNHFVSP